MPPPKKRDVKAKPAESKIPKPTKLALKRPSNGITEQSVRTWIMAIALKDLRGIDIFEGLVPEHAQKVLSICEQSTHKAGEVLFNDKDDADRFYFILRGKVRISKQIPGMGEEALAILEKGDCFGEMALIDNAPRSADAICNSDVELGSISTEAFETLLFVNKDLAYDLLWTFVRMLNSRLRETNEKMRAFLTMAGKF